MACGDCASEGHPLFHFSSCSRAQMSKKGGLQVPPTSLGAELAALLENCEGADVNFKVLARASADLAASNCLQPMCMPIWFHRIVRWPSARVDALGFGGHRAFVSVGCGASRRRAIHETEV